MNDIESVVTDDRLAGVLLGTAVGDALGLPAEGVSRRRLTRWYPGPLRHRFLFGRGMISDDTEHTWMLAQSFLDASVGASDDPDRFARKFAWRLRRWLLALPAGVGLGTAQACLKLWMGFPPTRSGVYSAGNGPAMRSALLGVLFADRPDRLNAWVAAATRLTHTDPRAFTAALAVADMAGLAAQTPTDSPAPTPDALASRLSGLAPDDAEWRCHVDAMHDAWTHDRGVDAFAESQGQGAGVSGYAYATVPVAVYAWRRHWGDFAATLESVIRLGGDADTVGAIAGALAGATVGASGIPVAWLDGVRDWPRGIPQLREVAQRLSQWKTTGHSPGAAPYAWFGVLPRNLLFLWVVLAHGFRRLAPPY